tara:strand:- start:575 stop:862 length:288 start_codon:yes stop_codon:yes gene_type:complete
MVEHSACTLKLYIEKIYRYEPGLYDKIKKEIFEKPFYYRIFYKEYKLGNWIEQSKQKYWNNMGLVLRVLWYCNLYKPNKLEYWDTRPSIITSGIY